MHGSDSRNIRNWLAQQQKPAGGDTLLDGGLGKACQLHAEVKQSLTWFLF